MRNVAIVLAEVLLIIYFIVFLYKCLIEDELALGEFVMIILLCLSLMRVV